MPPFNPFAIKCTSVWKKKGWWHDCHNKQMKESLNGWALQENSKVDSLEQEREELRRSNSTLTAELSKVGSLIFLGADNCWGDLIYSSPLLVAEVWNTMSRKEIMNWKVFYNFFLYYICVRCGSLNVYHLSIENNVEFGWWAGDNSSKCSWGWCGACEIRATYNSCFAWTCK